MSDPTAEKWFDTAAFVFPAYGTFGNSGRNTVEGPGYQNVNLALMKRLPLGGRSRLQLRLEAFNLFNHTNFNQPDNFLGSPTFGQILSAQSPRRFQLGREGDLLVRGAQARARVRVQPVRPSGGTSAWRARRAPTASLMQYRCFAPRTRMRPCEIDGVEAAGSPMELVAITSCTGPALMT